jgi:hypothetical protein
MNQRETVEQIRNTLHTPGLSQDVMLGQLLCDLPVDVWANPVVLDYCSQHLGVTFEVMQSAVLWFLQVQAFEDVRVLVCAFQATAPGVATPLASALRLAIRGEWAKQQIKTKFGGIDDEAYWCWGVDYGLQRAAWPLPPYDGYIGTYIPSTYMAQLKTSAVQMHVSYQNGITVMVVRETVRRWAHELQTPGVISKELEQLLDIEIQGLGWFSAHLDLGARHWEAQRRGLPPIQQAIYDELARDLACLASLLRVGAKALRFRRGEYEP